MSNDFEMPVKDKSQVAQVTEAPTEPVSKDKPAEKEPPKYDPEELLRIFDEMIFAGSYSETINIKGKLKVTFRTRSAEEMDAITQKIDTMSAVLVSTMMEKRSLLNLYYALTSYQGRDLSTAKFDEKVAFISKLPAAIVGMLMVTLFDFDSKINAVTKEGESNF